MHIKDLCSSSDYAGKVPDNYEGNIFKADENKVFSYFY